MYIHITYDREFDDLYMHLKEKYSSKIFDMEGIGEQTDISKFSKKFFSSRTTSDASVDMNANVDDVSVVAYNVEAPKPLFKLNSYYILWKELKRLYGYSVANDIIEKQLSGDIYIHDLHGIASAMSYCFNYSTYDIMLNGLQMIKKIKSIPPKHLHAFKSQLEQFIIIASNSTLGATGLADLLVVMSYYVKNIIVNKSDAHARFATEEDCWIYVKELITSFIYSVNFSLRANQSPFTNVSIYDDIFLDKMVSDYIFPDGSSPDIAIIKRLQEMYIDIMNSEMDRTPITFPVTTACFAVDSGRNILDSNFLEFIAKKNLKYGFINIYCGDSSTLSSCCRLRSEQDNEYFNSFGSGSSKIGSLGVCSINFPRAAIVANGDMNIFKTIVSELIEVCARVNNAKRHIVQKRINNGNEPLYTLGFMDLSRQYSTVGVNGLYECVDIMGLSMLEKDGQDFVVDILDTINYLNKRYEKKYSSPHNCEQVPGESMSVKMAEKDKLLGYQNKFDIYSNQFIPLTVNADMLDRIHLQGMFDKHFSGGAICHINVETRISDYVKIMSLITYAAKMGVVYHAINYNIQECLNGHMSVGMFNNCSVCNAEIVNNYTRVVGFLTNTKNWNKTRRDIDYPNR